MLFSAWDELGLREALRLRLLPLMGFAEFIIGPAEGRTRWLYPSYGLQHAVKLRPPHFLPPLSPANRLFRSWRFGGSASASALASSFPALCDFQEA